MSDDYRERKALSAGVVWTMVNECPELAWHESPWNPYRVEKNAEEFDIGTAAHLAVLENDKLADRVSIITAKDWRTDAAKELRAQAYADGKTPLLEKHFQLVLDIRKRLEESEAAELLFGGQALNEHAYYWECDGVSCKAKADRILLPPPGLVDVEGGGSILLDLKTADSPSPSAFQHAMVTGGHHLRAAWYLDGWNTPTSWGIHPHADQYKYVVVGKKPPHLVAVYELHEEALQRGRTLYRHGLALFRRCRGTDIWPGYGGTGAAGEKNKTITINLPAWYLNLFDARERAGEFDDDEDLAYE